MKQQFLSLSFRVRRCFCASAVGVWLSVGTAGAAITVGTAPFTYVYEPQQRLGLDTNAINQGVTFFREPPSFMNCCFVSPTEGTAHPYIESMTYTLVPVPGYRIQHIIALQRA